MVRANNEDAFAAEGDLFIIADGLGGLEHGEVASALAVETLKTLYAGHPPVDAKWLKRAFQLANLKIYALNRKMGEAQTMGTTLTVSSISREILIAHVGDCRVYRLRKKSLAQLTRDHSLDRHTLTRAMGLHESVEVDIYKQDVETGDVYLQCSDGLYSMVDDESIRRLLENPVGACDRLVEAAKRNGGHDNITVQVIQAV